MKKYRKYFVLLILVGSYYCIEPIQQVLDYKINYAYVTSYLAKSLYEDTATVSAEKTMVKDYQIQGDVLYVFPLDGKVVLPFGVMIADISNTKMEVVNTADRYTISHFRQKNVYLYSYVKEEYPLAYTDDFYIITGGNVRSVAAQLDIYYAQV